jgi:TPR repeat protein
MKFVFIAACLILLVAVQAPVAYAKEVQEYRTEADQYYLESNFKKAYKIYYKLAKTGDHYSQDRVSYMYANGEGKSVDLTEAYAWSVLAAEGGKEDWLSSSDELLLLTDDKPGAQERADKLKSKYGKDVLRMKAAKQAQRDNLKKSGVCTGTRLGCARG